MQLSPPRQVLVAVLRYGLAGCVALLLGVGALAPTAAAAQTNDGLRVTSSTVFDPDPGRQRIDVQSTYTMTNLQPDEVIGETVRSFFYTRWVVALPAVVADFSVTSAGRVLTTSIDIDPDTKDIVYGSIVLPFNLNYQQSVQLDVSYTIPGGEPRAGAGVARVNDSYLSFSVWTAGDPGLADVRILIPNGFAMDLQGDLDELTEVTRDGERMLEALSIEDPQHFFGQVYGRNDSGLLTKTAALPGAVATVRAWPDDPEWADFVVDAIRDDVPVIEDLTGLDWRAGDIEVIETVTPYLFGYGGWFNASSGVIEVGAQLERDLILHELGHAWFNDELIGGRWITEGLAEEFASRTIEATGDERPDPTRPDLDDPLRVPLAEWASPWTLGEEDAFAYEQFHYNASWWVIRQITTDVGLDAFADVLTALDEDDLPYPGDGPIEQTTQSTRWTHLFDLLEIRAGASDLDELFASYVLSAPDITKLAPRRDARASYDELVAAGSGWSPPLVVRRELTAWRFAEAQDLIDDARAVLGVRDAADAKASELDVVVEHPAEMTFETASTGAGLRQALELEQQLLADLESLTAARHELIELAEALGTNIEFAPLDYVDAVADVEAQRTAITEVASLRDQVETAATALDLASPEWPHPDGATDFAAEAALADARLATLTAIGAATTAVDAPRSFTQRVGLWRTNPGTDLGAARSAFERDDLDDALASTGTAEARLAQAGATGRARLSWAAITLAMALLTTLFIFWHHRRRQPAPTPPASTSDPQPVTLNQ